MENVRIILQFLLPLIFGGFTIWGLFHKCKGTDPCLPKFFSLAVAVLAGIVGLAFLAVWTYSGNRGG